MPSSPAPSRDPSPRVTVVAETDARARDVARTLAELGSIDAVGCVAGDAGDAGTGRGDVVVLAFSSIEASRRHALELRLATPERDVPPMLVLRCGAGDARAAAQLVRDGDVDDYAICEGAAAEADPDRFLSAVFAARRRAGAQRPTARTIRPRPLVFVVEDDEFARELVSATLGYDSVDLVFEANGDAAVARIREAQPDLVLMDVGLPGSDGVMLTQRLKADADLRTIPIVMLTGEARRDTLQRSLEAGAADFVVKPFTPDALRGKVAKYLSFPA